MTTFTVANKTYTDEDLLILIPIHYKDLFEGHAFRDMAHLSRAVMFANCANEARYYRRPWLVEQNEKELQHQLAQ
jgi:hypothetical protein